MVLTIALNDGKEIPALAWGSGTGGLRALSQTAIDMGAVALKAGILHLDTAQVGSLSLCLSHVDLVEYAAHVVVLQNGDRSRLGDPSVWYR